MLARSVFIPDNHKLTRMKSNLAPLVGVKLSLSFPDECVRFKVIAFRVTLPC